MVLDKTIKRKKLETRPLKKNVVRYLMYYVILFFFLYFDVLIKAEIYEKMMFSIIVLLYSPFLQKVDVMISFEISNDPESAYFKFFLDTSKFEVLFAEWIKRKW